MLFGWFFVFQENGMLESNEIYHASVVIIKGLSPCHMMKIKVIPLQNLLPTS